MDFGVHISPGILANLARLVNKWLLFSQRRALRGSNSSVTDGSASFYRGDCFTHHSGLFHESIYLHRNRLPGAVRGLRPRHISGRNGRSGPETVSADAASRAEPGRVGHSHPPEREHTRRSRITTETAVD